MTAHPIAVSTDAGPLAIDHAGDADGAALAALWARAGLTRPWNDPLADIALARRGPHSTILVARQAEAIAGSVMVGHDGHRGWLYYLAVEPALQGKGIGRALALAAEDWLKGRAVPMLMVRPDNAQVRAFYAALGYQEEERIVFSRRLDGN
jgi:ribosomal protein S18 acetylase RimI-like enzyme